VTRTHIAKPNAFRLLLDLHTHKLDDYTKWLGSDYKRTRFHILFHLGSTNDDRMEPKFEMRPQERMQCAISPRNGAAYPPKAPELQKRPFLDSLAVDSRSYYVYYQSLA